MNLRIQTYPTDSPMYTPVAGRDEPYTALEALEKGLDDLMALCDVMTDKFEGELNRIGRTSDDEMEG